MSIFIQSAYAQDAAAAGPSAWGNIIMMAVFIAIFYFMIWRPQSKRQKEHKAMIESIQVDSEVVFAAGLMGKVKSLTDEYAVVSLNDKNAVTIQKSSINAVLPPGTIEGVSN